jgi:hypothetical protein
VVYQGIKKALAIPEQDLRKRTGNNNKERDNNVIPFISTYNPNSDDNSKIVADLFGILKENDKTKHAFKDKILLQSKRQTANLKIILTSAKLNKSLSGKVTKCGDKRCSLCQNIIEGSEFIFNNCNKNFVIRKDMDCNTKFCIYAMRCRCGKTYIGETKDLRARTNLHRQHIGEYAPFTVSQHMFDCNSGAFEIMPIYKMMNDDDRERKSKESYFINLFHPELNSKK